MAGVWPPEISIVYGLWIQLFPNQSTKCFWNCVWRFQLFNLKLLRLVSSQSSQPTLVDYYHLIAQEDILVNNW